VKETAAKAGELTVGFRSWWKCSLEGELVLGRRGSRKIGLALGR
jgi:hypothetical protein